MKGSRSHTERTSQVLKCIKLDISVANCCQNGGRAGQSQKCGGKKSLAPLENINYSLETRRDAYEIVSDDLGS